MKTIQKTTAAILFAVMSFLVFTVGVSAAPRALPDPDIDTGKITVHKFKIPQKDESALPSNGTELENPPENAEPLAGVSFRVTRVSDNAVDPQDPGDYTGDKPYPATTEITNDSGIAVFDNLPLGVYLVEELDNPLVEESIPDFLVRVPMTNPQGNGFLYDIHVYPKNILVSQDVKIEKGIINAENNLVNTLSVNIGAPVTFQVTTTVPMDVAGSRRYDIEETMNTSFNYTTDSIRAVSINRDGTRTDIAPEYYTAGVTDGTFSVSFSGDGRAELAKALDGTGDTTPSVELRYEFVLNEQAQLATAIPSSAQLFYTNSLNVPYQPVVENAPTLTTGGLAILKFEADNETNTLAGAKFKVYATQGDAAAGNNAIQTPFGDTDWEVTTVGDGTALFSGLAYGNYYLVETQAPEYESGRYYNLLDAPVPVTVDATSHQNAAGIANRREGGGFTLPITGGAGTIIFTILGIALIVFAGILLFGGKRKRDRR